MASSTRLSPHPAPAAGFTAKCFPYANGLVAHAMYERTEFRGDLAADNKDMSMIVAELGQ